MNHTELIHRALVLAALTHHWHLTTRSYAAHVTLGELYTYFHDVADTLAEKLIGADQPFDTESPPFRFAFTDPKDAIAQIESFIKDLDALTQPTWLANIAQEIQGVLYGHLYKLKRLS